MNTRCALYGFVLICLGLTAYAVGVVAAPVRWYFSDPLLLRRLNQWLVWYSGVPVFAGGLLVAWDLIRNVSRIRNQKVIRNTPPANKALTVALTAYNDELSIGDAVRDFQSHPLVKRIIVISNNSTDRTMALASEAGAIVFNEGRQGYGACVHRALREALKHDDTELTVLCEGDLTFRAMDIDKLMAYIAHADIVNGSRI
ncbi:MAG: glycosyltransferase, partial [Verrucomicrobia bacterium]|nr:glycosyltransferase [Verrucomicrobiota bacterium]